jgi:hypothetical protein
MFWRVWTLFRDDRNRVDATDLCPSPSQICLDGFKLVDRVGFDRGGDAVFARYVLGHLPCPPCIPPSGGGAEGRREAQSRRPSWGLAASGHRKLE